MSGWDLPSGDTPQHEYSSTDQPNASGWGAGGGDYSQTDSHSTQEPRAGGGGGRSFGPPDSSSESGGWGQQRNNNDQEGWGNSQATRSFGGGGGGGNGRRDFDSSNDGFGYRRGRGAGSMNWDRGGRGRGGGFSRGRGERGPGGWPNPQEYSTPPHAFNYQGNGSSSQWPGNLSRGGFDGGYPSFRGGYGGGGARGDFSNSPSFGRRDFNIGVTPVDFSKLDLPPFERNFYKEHSKVAERSEAEVEEWRKAHSITISGGQAPKPVLTWGETKLPKYILEAYVVEKGYQAPTIIQSQSIPMALSGRDLIAISETGSGKTLAYAAPAIVHIAAQPPTKPVEGPICLILAPTRELATQILRECQALGKGGNVRSACAYGGVPRNEQLSDIRSGVDILIATPGRLLDFLSSGDVSLERVTYFVLDEADRMISLGFEREVKQIISMIRPDRQTLMFSATFPPEIRSIAREFYRDAITVHLGLDVLTACSNIDQRVEVHRNFGSKIQRLHQVLVEEVAPIQGKALIFVNKKVTAIEVTDYLRSNSIEAISLHGDKRQEERDFALSEFRASSIPVLVGTDVCQRGLDIPNVTLVVNFDCPNDPSSYVHRIGRTGRAGKRGKALTFFGSRDSEGAEKIIQVLASNDVEIPEELQQLAQGYSYSSSSLPFSTTPEFPDSQKGEQPEEGGVSGSGWGTNAGDGWGQSADQARDEPSPPQEPESFPLSSWGISSSSSSEKDDQQHEEESAESPRRYQSRTGGEEETFSDFSKLNISSSSSSSPNTTLSTTTSNESQSQGVGIGKGGGGFESPTSSTRSLVSDSSHSPSTLAGSEEDSEGEGTVIEDQFKMKDEEGREEEIVETSREIGEGGGGGGWSF
ncbi:hypothetical protein JCM5350_002144 [Sporobolomyces pararoseus]